MSGTGRGSMTLFILGPWTAPFVLPCLPEVLSPFVSPLIGLSTFFVSH